MAGRRRGLVWLVLALAAGIYAVQLARWRPLALQGNAPADGFTRVVGAVHAHTTLSDGGGTPEEVIAAARAAGLGFLVLTDHNNLDAAPLQGYHDGLLVIVGSELSTTAGHVLGLGIRDPIYRFSGDARDALDDVRDLGGFAFAAHPTSNREDFKWSGNDLPGPWGLELLSGDSEWRRANGFVLARTALGYGFNPGRALLGSLARPSETLALWDRLLTQRDVVGIGGTDAHSRVQLGKRHSLRAPSYAALFSVVGNTVLLRAPLSGDAVADTAAVLEALRAGRSYVAVAGLAPPHGFRFEASDGTQRTAIGEHVVPSAGLRLLAGGATPAGTRLRLLRDGSPVAEAEAALDEPAATPGVYRVEAVVPGWDVPWVLSNPIYVFDSAAQAARSQRAAWPSEPEPPQPALLLDTFEGRSVFAPGHDQTSTLELPLLDPHGGLAGSGAARLAFHVGIPSATTPSPYCALVDTTPRDLRGRQGIVFSIRSDREYRVWFQVRDQNPASTDDDGQEYWFASVRTQPQWRRVAIPFARLRSINPRSDGRLDLDKVRGIVFVLDRGSVKPDTRGTLWLDDLGLY